MQTTLIHCPKCKAWLVEAVFNRFELSPCPSCAAPLQVEVFPAFFRRIDPGHSGEVIMVEGESGCFYHPARKAVHPCDACGRFLCALCDCELNGKHFCPGCLETGKTKGSIKQLDNYRVLYDNIAFVVAALPVLLLFTIYFTFITAPISLFLAIRYWNAPRSIVRRHRFVYILAMLLAVLQIGGWVVVIYSLVTHG